VAYVPVSLKRASGARAFGCSRSIKSAAMRADGV
jgi:hypothetical protein